jgi:four helix bundle protein
MSSTGSFRDLRVWREATKVAPEVYRGTASFPRHELCGLTQQICRAAVSVPSNIAEGKGRHSDREFAHFLFNGQGSLLELQTQVMLAEELEYLPAADAERLLALAECVGRALSGLINSLRGFSRGDAA